MRFKSSLLLTFIFLSAQLTIPVHAQEIGLQLYSLREQMKIDVAGIIAQAKKAGTEFLIVEDESSRSVVQIPQSVYFIQNKLEE